MSPLEINALFEHLHYSQTELISELSASLELTH